MYETVTKMMQTHPKGTTDALQPLARCIEACFACAQTCVACADACLAEAGAGELLRCIRLNLDCADICEGTGRMLSRRQEADVELLRQAVALCRLSCRKCGEECRLHASLHEHCAFCEQACRACEHACEHLLSAWTNDGSTKKPS